MVDDLQPLPSFNDPAFVSAFDEAPLWSARFGALLLEQVALRPGMAVLDVGCGAGFPLFELAHCCGPTARLVGVDVWGPALARAVRKRAVYGLSNVHLLLADVARLPLSDASFDLVVSNLGVNNFADPPGALRECARVAQRGAHFALTTNPRGHYAEFYAAFRDVLSAFGLSAQLARLSENEEHRGTQQSVVAMIESAGFAVERVLEDRFTMRFADGDALLRHWLVRIGFLDGWRSVVDPADAARVFAETERRLTTRARAEGGLTMTVPMLYIEAHRV